MNTLTVDNEKWDDFADRLCGEDGCNFWISKDGKPIWNCDGTTEKAEAILKDMGFDVKSSLEYFGNFGGYCDCEILLNVGYGHAH